MGLSSEKTPMQNIRETGNCINKSKGRIVMGNDIESLAHTNEMLV